jgi:DNA-binding NtrC family response regulator
VLAFTSFEEALQSLRQSPPDAAVVSITPAHLPWRDFQHQCALRNPRVPVLYVSCLFSNAREAGLEPVEGEAFFLQKPSSKAELECALSSLLSASKEARGQVER